MWPMVLDYTKDECQRMLRKLELEAYAAVVSAFRAQGELTKDKKKTLQELSNILCISLERHRAEIRRAVNDERLNTIAERIVGPNTSSDWAIEGRRLVPLMPRLVPQTAFSALANNIANNMAATAAAQQSASKNNAASPTPHGVAAAAAATAAAVFVDREPPHATGNGPCLTAPSGSGLNGPVTTTPRALQGAVLVAPTGMTRPPMATGCTAAKLPGPVVVKTEPPSAAVVAEKQVEEDSTLRKRKRSLSLDSLSSPPAAASASISRVSPTVPATTSPPPPVAAIAAAAVLPRVTSNGPVVTKLVVPTSVPIATATGTPGVTTKVINLPVASASTPVRVSLASVQKTTTVPACSQKVILVSTTTTAATSPVSSSLLQPPLAVPVVKTVSAPATIPHVHHGRAPTFMGLPVSSAGHYFHSTSSSSSFSTSSSAALTSVASIVTAPVPSASVSVTSESGVVRLRPRAMAVNPRLPLRIPTRGAPPKNAPPLAPLLPPPQHPCPLPSSALYGKATISVPKGAIMQYRQEGMKIIAQGQLPFSTTKLVSKGGPGSAVPNASSSGSLSLTPRVSTVSITSNQPRVVNVITASSQPGLVRTISRTVTPSTALSQRQSPTMGMRPMMGTGLHQGPKPNVIVVHKAQVWPQTQAGTSSSSTSTIAHLTKSTESITYLQRQDRAKAAVGAPVTVVKTTVPLAQQCSSPLIRVARDTTVRTLPPPTFMRKPLEPSLEASSTCSSNSGGGSSNSSSGGGASGNGGGEAGGSGAGGSSSSSTLLAEVMQAAGILQEQAEEEDSRGGGQQPPPLLAVGEEAVPPAEVEVAVDTVPLDDNAVLLDDGHHLLVDNRESREMVVEEAPCLLQDQAIVCHEVELAAQPGLQLEVVSTSPSPANSLEDKHSQPSQNGRLAAEEPASPKVEPGTSSLSKRPEPKNASNDDSRPSSAPRSASDKPPNPGRKRPGLGGDRKDAPGNSNGVMASEVAERLGLTVSGTIAIPPSSANTTEALQTAPTSIPANALAITAAQPARLVSLQSLRRASHPSERPSDSDLAVPGPSNVFAVASMWRHGAKTPHSSSSLPSRQQQLNGPHHASATGQPTPPISVGATLSAFDGLPSESSSAVMMESVNENSNADVTDGVSGGRPSTEPSASSNRAPTLSSAENSADNSVDNSVENLMLRNPNRNSDDSLNDSSRESSSNEGDGTNEEEDSVGPTDVQDSISSSSSAAVLYLRNPDEEQSAIISSSSNDHGRRDVHKAKRGCDVSSSTSVSASQCLVVPTPSTAAIFGEHQLSAAASSTPSAPEQNSPDQTSEGTSSAGHFQLPSCFGEGSGGGSSNVTSAELEIAVVSSPTPDAQEIVANVCGEGSSNVVVGSEEQNNSAVESSEQEEGPVEVSSAVATVQPGTSSQREEVTSAENGSGLSSAASNEVTSAVSCPSFDDGDDDDDGVDGNEAGQLVTALMVSSDEEVSTAEVVLVHSEDVAEITCSTVDATTAATASGSTFHLDMRPLSVSSTEESEYLGGSVEVDSHEVVPDVQAFSAVGTGSSCSIRGVAAAAAVAMGTASPASDEASSDSHTGVESSRAVSASNSVHIEDQRVQNAASDQPTQSETGDGLSVALATEPVESGNDAEEVYELLICDSEASEGITSVMVDSVSSTVFGAQRNAGPSPSTYHLLSLPSCSSSGPSTSSSSPAIDVASLTLAYHRTDDAAHLDTSSSSSSSSSGSNNSAQPIVADSSATLLLRVDTAAASNGVVPSCSSNGSRGSQVDNGQNGVEAAGTGSSSSGSGGGSSGSSDLVTPGNVDEFEVCENGLTSASSSVGDVILVGAHACVAGTSSSEIVISTDGEVTTDMTVSSENFDEDSGNSNNDDIPSNSLGVSSSASQQHSHAGVGLENGVQDGPASTSRFHSNLDEGLVASSAVADVTVGSAVVVGVGTDPVERAVTSSAPMTSASLSQPSTSRGTTAGSQLLKRKRRVTALIDESLCASVHVSGWARVASGLLDRVCKFRGANRSKGMLPPAHWFLEPVDPEDAPGYYDVIEQPMDFSTIKKKLEGGQYRDLTDFHEDMLLVQRNCQTYNPPEHEASQDCEEVFAFYLQEYNRLVEKWQKSHLLSSPKRSKPS